MNRRVSALRSDLRGEASILNDDSDIDWATSTRRDSEWWKRLGNESGSRFFPTSTRHSRVGASNMLVVEESYISLKLQEEYDLSENENFSIESMSDISRRSDKFIKPKGLFKSNLKQIAMPINTKGSLYSDSVPKMQIATEQDTSFGNDNISLERSFSLHDDLSMGRPKKLFKSNPSSTKSHFDISKENSLDASNYLDDPIHDVKAQKKTLFKSNNQRKSKLFAGALSFADSNKSQTFGYEESHKRDVSNILGSNNSQRILGETLQMPPREATNQMNRSKDIQTQEPFIDAVSEVTTERNNSTLSKTSNVKQSANFTMESNHSTFMDKSLRSDVTIPKKSLFKASNPQRKSTLFAGAVSMTGTNDDSDFEEEMEIEQNKSKQDEHNTTQANNPAVRDEINDDVNAQSRNIDPSDVGIVLNDIEDMNNSNMKQNDLSIHSNKSMVNDLKNKSVSEENINLDKSIIAVAIPANNNMELLTQINDLSLMTHDDANELDQKTHNSSQTSMPRRSGRRSRGNTSKTDVETETSQSKNLLNDSNVKNTSNSMEQQDNSQQHNNTAHGESSRMSKPNDAAENVQSLQTTLHNSESHRNESITHMESIAENSETRDFTNKQKKSLFKSNHQRKSKLFAGALSFSDSNTSEGFEVNKSQGQNISISNDVSLRQNASNRLDLNNSQKVLDEMVQFSPKINTNQINLIKDATQTQDPFMEDPKNDNIEMATERNTSLFSKTSNVKQSANFTMESNHSTLMDKSLRSDVTIPKKSLFQASNIQRKPTLFAGVISMTDANYDSEEEIEIEQNKSKQDPRNSVGSNDMTVKDGINEIIDEDVKGVSLNITQSRNTGLSEVDDGGMNDNLSSQTTQNNSSRSKRSSRFDEPIADVNEKPVIEENINFDKSTEAISTLTTLPNDIQKTENKELSLTNNVDDSDQKELNNSQNSVQRRSSRRSMGDTSKMTVPQGNNSFNVSNVKDTSNSRDQNNKSSTRRQSSRKSLTDSNNISELKDPKEDMESIQTTQMESIAEDNETRNFTSQQKKSLFKTNHQRKSTLFAGALSFSDSNTSEGFEIDKSKGQNISISENQRQNISTNEDQPKINSNEESQQNISIRLNTSNEQKIVGETLQTSQKGNTNQMNLSNNTIQTQEPFIDAVSEVTTERNNSTLSKTSNVKQSANFTTESNHSTLMDKSLRSDVTIPKKLLFKASNAQRKSTLFAGAVSMTGANDDSDFEEEMEIEQNKSKQDEHNTMQAGDPAVRDEINDDDDVNAQSRNIDPTDVGIVLNDIEENEDINNSNVEQNNLSIHSRRSTRSNRSIGDNKSIVNDVEMDISNGTQNNISLRSNESINLKGNSMVTGNISFHGNFVEITNKDLTKNNLSQIIISTDNVEESLTDQNKLNTPQNSTQRRSSLRSQINTNIEIDKSHSYNLFNDSGKKNIVGINNHLSNNSQEHNNTPHGESSRKSQSYTMFHVSKQIGTEEGSESLQITSHSSYRNQSINQTESMDSSANQIGTILEESTVNSESDECSNASEIEDETNKSCVESECHDNDSSDNIVLNLSDDDNDVEMGNDDVVDHVQSHTDNQELRRRQPMEIYSTFKKITPKIIDTHPDALKLREENKMECKEYIAKEARKIRREAEEEIARMLDLTLPLSRPFIMTRPYDIIATDLFCNKTSEHILETKASKNIRAAANSLINKKAVRGKDKSRKTSMGKVTKRQTNKTKLHMKELWITRKLFNFIQNKLKHKWGLMSVQKSELFVKFLANIVNSVEKHDGEENHSKVEELKVHMANMNVITTHRDFVSFVEEYLPNTFRIKSVPAPGRNIPKFRGKLDEPILKKKK